MIYYIIYSKKYAMALQRLYQKNTTILSNILPKIIEYRYSKNEVWQIF